VKCRGVRRLGAELVVTAVFTAERLVGSRPEGSYQSDCAGEIISRIPSGARLLKGERTMNCQQLAARIEAIQPEALPRDVARLCLLLTNYVENLDDLCDEDRLSATWRDMGIKLQAATDQHAAMTEELESLANSDPRDFTPDQIWVLIRAIKVQSQVLQLYVGNALIDV
jgi:hypothetical protein